MIRAVLMAEPSECVSQQDGQWRLLATLFLEGREAILEMASTDGLVSIIDTTREATTRFAAGSSKNVTVTVLVWEVFKVVSLLEVGLSGKLVAIILGVTITTAVSVKLDDETSVHLKGTKAFFVLGHARSDKCVFRERRG
ncbi:MAG: hypothetical protein HOP36_01110 [Methyloglobulus sp.]|nr:hypothetical protein [Methyloglobulus sp.]